MSKFTNPNAIEGQPVLRGDIKIGLLVRLQYDGTDFRLMNPQATS